MFKGASFFVAGITLTCVIACPRSGTAQALQEIRIGSSVIGFSSLMSYFARDLKFFEKEGLDAKIIYAQTNVVLAALTAGNFDYTNLATSAVEATLRGMPLRLIAVTNAEPVWGIVVRKGITQVSELKGKNLGVSSFGGTSYSAALYVLKHFGLRPKEDVMLVATGGTTERIAALKHGSVDAAVIPAPGDMKAEQEGFKILMDAGSIYKLPNGGMSTTVTKIRQNPGEVRRVVRALVLATKFFVEPQNKSEVTKYLTRVFNLDPASTEEFYGCFVPSLSTTGIVETMQRGLVSGYTARANIGLYCGRDSTAARDLTDGKQVVDGEPHFVVFGKQAWTCYLAVRILNSFIVIGSVETLPGLAVKQFQEVPAKD